MVVVQVALRRQALLLPYLFVLKSVIQLVVWVLAGRKHIVLITCAVVVEQPINIVFKEP